MRRTALWTMDTGMRGKIRQEPGIYLGPPGLSQSQHLTSYCKTVVLVLAITTSKYDVMISYRHDLLFVVLRVCTTILGIQGQYGRAYRGGK